MGKRVFYEGNTQYMKHLWKKIISHTHQKFSICPAEFTFTRFSWSPEFCKIHREAPALVHTSSACCCNCSNIYFQTNV